ncbi:Hypothetical predicted protein [Lecanosticta acicola]|uniref:DUF7587 domain-containing protein n=1 Tax=Lecanosticta acicola TaxID=111012 RepID=A0AAI8Z2I5_9PEZI|nr:Hypothetical predicted protein [Lecanosticta acicola]
MSSSALLTAHKVKVLLDPDRLDQHSEDKQRPWCPSVRIDSNCKLHMSTTQQELWNKPLLRLWDRWSGSQPDEDDRMSARDPSRSLATRQDRVETLTWHADNKIWEETPYLSFTSESTAIEDLARQRNRAGREGLSLTVIDPRLRLCRGRPVLHYEDEMRQYGIEDPYHQGYRYYQQHYLCLWEVAPKEIVGHWRWDEISQYPDWYEEFILPKFRTFRKGWWPQSLTGLKSLAAQKAGAKKSKASMASTDKMQDNKGADAVESGESTKDSEDDIAEKLQNMTL